MEMLGLVFIVIVVVLGIVLYLASARGPVNQSGLRAAQSATSLQTSLAQTTIPQCRTTFAQVVAACIVGSRLSCIDDPCIALNKTIAVIALRTNLSQRYAYHLGLSGTIVQNDGGCDVSAPGVATAGVYNLPMAAPGGVQRNLTLVLCR